MLDLARLERLRLSGTPVIQRVVALALLVPNYEIFPRVRIDFEDDFRVPEQPVIFAMNHTDHFNYWPFQYAWWRRRSRFTATWVKGKYYGNPLLALFLELTNNLPTVSRGYLIAQDFLATLGRKPTADEYGRLRALVGAAAAGEAPSLPEDLPRALFETPRDILGHPFDPARETWPEAMDALYRTMMRRFVDLHREAADLGLDLLVFPQGTRSKRLSKGRIGLAQIALHLGRPIVPIGCSGSDALYPGKSPIAKGGRVVYRFGEPLFPEDFADVAPQEPFEPFTPEAERDHRDAFQTVVDRVMDRIDGLVDEEYRFSADRASQGVQGMDRFV